MQPRLPITRDLVLVGGGHAHALLLRRWAMKPLAGARVTLVSPSTLTPYSGMLPGHVAGHYTREEIHIDLVPLARAAGARLVIDEARGLDRALKELSLRGRPPIAYDVISFNTGALTPTLDGAESHTAHLPVKPVEPFLAGWERFLETAPMGARIVVIGAGLGGVELTLAMRHRLRERLPKLTLLERAPGIMPELPEAARRRFMRRLDEAGVTVRLGVAADRIEPDGVVLADGERLPADLIVSTAGARPANWIATLELPTDSRGFLRVDAMLRSVEDPSVFAAGDVACMDASPRPKAGVFAVRQSPRLFDNLQAALSDQALTPFRPQRAYLKLVSTGERRAVAEKWGVSLEGAWVWRWKDWIDRRFMRRLSELPEMDVEEKVPKPAAAGLAAMLARDPLCGACGAKLGLGALRQAFAALTPEQRAVFANQIGDDAAVLNSPRRGERVISTDHLRAFTEDFHVFARITAIHALGDIWSMGATPEAALLSVTLPAMAPEKQAASLREILGGAAEVFAAEEAEILGGHSSEGPEAAIGFTVIGRLAEGAAISQEGGEAGDALILTKPIGVGVILAAEMRGQAPGPVYEAALRSMLTSSGTAARLLAEHGATAMTDVTGFGLAGHLGRMLEAAGLDAELSLERVPFLDGAEALARAGVRSSLYESNAAASAPLTGPGFDPLDPRCALLLDPQTAGGMLAALPAEAAGPAIDALQEAGVGARVIGRLTPRDGPGPKILLV